jgi:hypothetical protein
VLNLERLIVGFVLLSGFAGAVIWLHYRSLESAAGGIGDPVTTTITEASVQDLGRGGIAASVSFTDQDGNQVVAELPDLGHDRSSYDTPFVIVYERTEPTRAMLATDWEYAGTVRPKVTERVALVVLVADSVITLVFVGRSLVVARPGRVRRSAR